MVKALKEIRSFQSQEKRTDELCDKSLKEESSMESQTETEATGTNVEEKKMVAKEQDPESTAQAVKGVPDEKGERETTEPTLENPKVGNPISHGQVIDLSRQLKAEKISSYTLEGLLKGARVYIPPPPQKKEPVTTHYHENRQVTS